MTNFFRTLLLTLICVFPHLTHAASLSVSPIRLDMVEPGNTASLTLQNNGALTITAQVRVFRWSLLNGADNFTETRDIVVSPPIATLTPGAQFQVRVLRNSRAPVQGEESYRVVVDEVPESSHVRTVGLTVAIRYALPLFVISPTAGKPKIDWTLKSAGGKNTIVASNVGETHLRIANLTLGGAKVGNGLAGYVLGRSARVFELPRNVNPVGAVRADTDLGPLNATLAR